MTAPALRPWSGLQSEDAWRRASFVDTALEPGGVVSLAWDEDEAGEPAAEEPTPDVALPDVALPVGLAFDPWCRLYRSRPAQGTVERVRWSGYDPLAPRNERDVVDLFASSDGATTGAFTDDDAGGFVARPSEDAEGPLDQPTGLAIDHQGRLFVAERVRGGVAGRVRVFDLERRRLMRTVETNVLHGSPVDLEHHEARVYALLVDTEGAASLAILTATRPAVHRALPVLPGAPSRLAVDPEGTLVVLVDAGTAAARLVRVGDVAAPEAVVEDHHTVDVPWASDLVFLTSNGSGASTPGADRPGAATLVVARTAAADFLRFRLRPGGHDRLAPLEARGYDGRGIARTPDDRVVFWTARGPRHAVAARRRYRRRGRVISFRLDAEAFQAQWGRLFVDACIPRGTDVRVRCVAFDEPPEAPPMAPRPPANSDGTPPPHADLTPPHAPALLHLDDADETPADQRLHRRTTGREWPWSNASSAGDRDAAGAFVTYEAPVLASPGRYLWVVVELRGDGRATPRVRQLRVAHAGHDLLRRLPRAFAREPVAADFLQRYLASFEGFLGDLDNRAATRHALLDPRSVPTSMLPWLGSFVGLVLDARWPETATRTALAEAVWLFRFRGTVPGLKRLLEIYLGRAVVLIEHHRLRGHGGAFVGGALGAGADASLTSHAVLGGGFRVGGAVGDPSAPEAASDVRGSARSAPPADGFATHAHRFTVVVPMALTTEQRQVVDHILDVHRPAHTLVQVCSIDAGMRVGVGLYVALTTLVGRTGGFGRLRLGASTLGRQALLGTPSHAGRAGSAQLGRTTRIG